VSVALRSPVRDDAAAITSALNEFNRPAGFDLDSPEEVGVWLEFPSFDLEQDVRVAIEGGKIVGYAEAVLLPDDDKFVFGDVRAGSRHVDASAALLDFVEQRARELASPGGRLRIWTGEREDAWRQFLESRGFEVQRYSLRMVAELKDEPAEPQWPEESRFALGTGTRTTAPSTSSSARPSPTRLTTTCPRHSRTGSTG
jgi:hypothetical protein